MFAVQGACTKQPETWTAFVSSPWAAGDASKAIYGCYESFKQCQSASIGALRHWASERPSDFGSYECGIGCLYEKQGNKYFCKETLK